MNEKMWNQGKLIVRLLCLLMTFTCHVSATANSQDDLKVKVDELIRSQNYDELNQLGSTAIPYIVEILRSSSEFTGREFCLIWLIKDTEGEGGDQALVGLLHATSPHIRGLAAMYVGSRRLKAAMPGLVTLLQDDSVWSTTIGEDVGDAKVTDQEQQAIRRVAHRPGKDNLVKDAAVNALEQITGLQVSNSESFDKRARAWLRWWVLQQMQESDWASH